jgi:hypothetical protein
VIKRTAGLVERALERAGLKVPLLVLRGDGGAMGIDSFRRQPSFTVGSGPAAGVAAALHEVGATDALVLECGGTSSNVTVVRGGRPELRSIKVMGRPTAIRSVESWVVGAAGGSLARLGRRRIAETGPRSAHVAGLHYACFADPAQLAEAELELVAPRPGDPERYAVVRAGEERFAITASCAANALGLVAEGSYARGSQQAAKLAMAPLAEALRTSPEGAARQLLDRALDKIGDAVSEAARASELPDGFPLIALGGAAEALVPEVARRVGCEIARPEHPEVLSSIGAALSLIRSEAVRSAESRDTEAASRIRFEVTREAERACVDAGAAPATVTVETGYEPAAGVIRAIATGAVALERGAASRSPADPDARLRAAAGVLDADAESLSLLSESDFYRVYSENGSGRVAAIDPLAGVALAERAQAVFSGEGREFVDRLREEVDAASVNLGIASMLPRVALLCGPRILDCSDARRPDDIVATAERLLSEERDTAVAVLAR